MSCLESCASFSSLRRRAALFLVPLVAALAVAGTGPAGAQDQYEPDPQVVAAVRGYAAETGNGFDHVLRWMRVLKTFGAVENMTAAEAQENADRYWAKRWDPVVEELRKLEDGQDEPDEQVVAAVRGYAGETGNGFEHVLRWMRVLKTFGAIEDMTAAEAREYAETYTATRWNPVVEELRKLEAAAAAPEPADTPEPTPESGEPQVSITASPASPRPGEVVELSAVIDNAPAGSDPSYTWEIDLGGGSRISLGRAATASYAHGGGGTTTFLLTVSYGTGDSLTSDPLTVEWTEPAPNLAPAVDEQAQAYGDFVGQRFAPRGVKVSRRFQGIFSDPDGDELTYSVSVPGDRSRLVDSLGTQLGITDDEFDVLAILVDADDDWKAISPALPDPLTIPVTLTATDPGGLSVSLTSDFVTDWESHPALLSAAASPQAIALAFDLEVQANPAPIPGQFTVHVLNEDGSAATVAVSGVSVSGKVVTLQLASALESGLTVTLDYAHDDEAPLKRAASGGDSAPGFTGRSVDVSLLDPPANFVLGVEAGQLDLTAAWDAVEGATSYRLRWRQHGGDFRPGDAITVTDAGATITVSGDGRWEVRLQGCNEAGCGPEATSLGTATSSLCAASPPNGVVSSRVENTITVSWETPAAREACELTGFIVDLQGGDGSALGLRLPDPSQTTVDVPVLESVQYQVSVVAVYAERTPEPETALHRVPSSSGISGLRVSEMTRNTCKEPQAGRAHLPCRTRVPASQPWWAPLATR